MAKRKLEGVDVSDIEITSKEFEPFARFLLRALRSSGYDYRQAGTPRRERTFIREFALRHGLLYQTLWVAATGQAVPRDDFVIAVAKALGLRRNEEVFVLLLLAHRARTQDPYRRQFDPIIEACARKAGLTELLR